MSFGNYIIPALLVLATLSASYFHGGYDFTYAPALLICLGIATYSLISTLGQTVVLPRRPAILLTFGFAAYLSLSLLWSSVPYSSLVTWLNLMALPLILVGLLCLPGRTTLIRNSVIALLPFIAAIALIILWQYLVKDENRAAGLLPNPNNSAALLNLFLVPACALALFGSGKKAYAASVFSVLLFAALLATGSRGGLICFTVTLPFLLIACKDRARTHIRKLAGGIILGALVLAGFFFLTSSPLPETLSAIGQPAKDASGFERLAIWQATVEIIKDHVLTGTGLGSFYLYYPSYRLPADQLSWGHWAHNDALQFAAETGIFAIVLFYAVLASWFWLGITALKKTDLPQENKVMIAGITGGLMAFALHAHVEFQFYLLVSLICASILMAALYHLASDEQTGYLLIRPHKSDSLIWRGSLAVTALLIGLTIASTVAGNWHMVKADEAMRSGQLDNFITHINKARQYAPRSFADPQVRLAGLYIDLLSRPAGQMTKEDRQTTFIEAEYLLAGAGTANPAWADIDHKRAKLYLYGDDENVPDRKNKVRAAWDEALRKNPMHYHAREEYIRYLMRQGEVEGAYKLVQTGFAYPATKAARTTFTKLEQQMRPLIAARASHIQPSPAPTQEEEAP